MIGRLAEFGQVLALTEAPDVRIGPHCDRPYSCDLKGECWAFLPEWPVTDLVRDRSGRCWDLLDRGICSLADIHTDEGLNEVQSVQVFCSRTGERHVEPGRIREFLDSLECPVAFFDLETCTSAVPLFDGTRPYQQIPFQFSLHIQREPGAQPEHHAFLAEGSADPRPEFLRALGAALPPTGSIVVFNASFEQTRVREFLESFPAEAAFLTGFDGRLVDLLVPFRQFWFHDRAQHGSNSIKDVLPAVTGEGYGDLSIGDGNAAARAFLEAEHGGAPGSERAAIRRGLLEYCQLDTRGMIDIMDELRRIAG